MALESEEDLFVKVLKQMRVANDEAIATVQREHAAMASQGTRIPLADLLVKSGVITADARAKVEESLRQQKGKVGVQIGVYKVLKKLGEGGMGTVFLAEDTASKNHTIVALKVLSRKNLSNKEFLARFHREARAASQLKHPNIVGTFAGRDSDTGEAAGEHFYAMEYCEGETLEDHIKKNGFVPWRKAIEIAVHIARGLQFAHSHGFVHRDIKPGNIFLTKQGVCKILDMGLTKNIADSSQASLTLDHQILGTPHYVAPEQAEGRKDADGRADIYSLGATLFHMVTGRVPFDGETPANIIIKHVTEPAPNPQQFRGDLPDPIAHVILKMLAKDPAERYRDCTTLLMDIEPVLDGKMPTTRSAQAANAAIEQQQRQADEDAAFIAKCLHYGKFAAIGLAVLLVFLIGRSVIRSLLGPSKRDLENRHKISLLREEGEKSAKLNDIKDAYEKYDSIIRIVEAEASRDSVITEELERAKAEREKLGAQLAAAETAKRKKEDEAQRQKEEQEAAAAAAAQRKAEEEKKRAEDERAREAAKKAEEGRAAEETRKADEARAAEETARAERERKEQEAREAARKKEEEARLERERRKEANKRRDQLRNDCLAAAETAVAEAARLEKTLSDAAYNQFVDALRDRWPNVQSFLGREELTLLIDEVNDTDSAALRKHLKAAGELLLECQGDWREKKNAGKEGAFDRQSWLGKIYGEVQDAQSALEKFKKME